MNTKTLSYVFTVLLVAIVLLFVFVPSAKGKTTTEPFAVNCPTSAIRGPDAKITVQPGNLKFDTMSDYTEYLKTIYSQGAPCVPPKVEDPAANAAALIQNTDLGEIPYGGQAAAAKETALVGLNRKVLDTGVEGEQTYAKTPIDDVNDYKRFQFDVDNIYELESQKRNELSTKAIVDLTNERIYDWPNLPFNSQTRADKEESFITNRLDDAFREPKSGIFFRNVSGENMIPPDLVAQDEAEKDALKTYAAPTVKTDLMAKEEKEIYDVGELVKKMYSNDKNWEPVVERVGGVDENTWKVSELRPKPGKKEYYENSEPLTLGEAQKRGLIVPPNPRLEITSSTTDPYFTKTGVADPDNDRVWKYDDFSKWTPGLERMFAPTYQTLNWY